MNTELQDVQLHIASIQNLTQVGSCNAGCSNAAKEKCKFPEALTAAAAALNYALELLIVKRHALMDSLVTVCRPRP